MASVRKDAVEIIPDRLYYVTVRTEVHEAATHKAHFWSTDEFTYWKFFLDWGPLSLGSLYRFCRTLNFKLRSERLKGKTIFVYSGLHAHKRTNAAFLLCAWQLLYCAKSPDEAILPFRDVYPPFPPFHDASPCVCTYDLNILDCLRGLCKACHFRFFDFHTFDVEEYEHFEQVEHGDLNWVVEGKFIAFAGPHSRSEMTKEGYRTLTPKNYIPYFKRRNVSLVVRLNKKYYDEKLFVAAGIDHVDAYFLDGGVPPPRVLQRFLSVCEATPGAIAVHCKAGLGRTGTCIGCYLMKHYGLTAPEAIGWMRICRPGSVIGPQQHFLQEMEASMHREGVAFRENIGSSSTLSPPTRARASGNSGERDTSIRRGVERRITRSFSRGFPQCSPRCSSTLVTDVPKQNKAIQERAAARGGGPPQGALDGGWGRTTLGRARHSDRRTETPPYLIPTPRSRGEQGQQSAEGSRERDRSACRPHEGRSSPTLIASDDGTLRLDEEYNTMPEFFRLKIGDGGALTATVASANPNRSRRSGNARRSSVPKTMGKGEGSAGRGGQLGRIGKAGVGNDALSSPIARTGQRRPVGERLARATEAVSAAASATMSSMVHTQQQRPQGESSGAGRRRATLGDVWELGAGEKTQGDLLRERRVVRGAEAGPRGI